MSSQLIQLSNAVRYSEGRIKSNDLVKSDYIGIDNLLPNKEGMKPAVSLPAGTTSIPSYKQENILVGNIRPYLKKIWLADRSGGCSADVLNFEVNENFHPEFVYYSMLRDDFFTHMMKGAKGTKMPRGDKAHILEFLIPNFDIGYQKSIADVLSTLDKKITINKKIISELDALGVKIYKFWFEQFNFPDSNGKPYKEGGGMMRWDELLKREIPVEWNSSTLAGLINCDKSGDWGVDVPGGNYTLAVNCIRGTDINGLNGLEECDPPKRFILDKNREKILNHGDLIVEISGGGPTQSTGRISFVTSQLFKRFENPLICSNFCKAISLKDELLLYPFSYYWNELYKQGTFFSFEGKTSGIKNLLFEAATQSCLMPIPDSKTLLKFKKIIDEFETKKQICLKENKHLVTLRDWLLPLLMNGQVTVNS